MRIGASISGFERLLLNQLASANAAAAANALRLATGKQVSRPSDDPAAFVQISSFNAQLSRAQAASRQVSAAANVAAQAQLALDQVHSKLDDIRAALLTDEDGSLDATTRAQKQAEIDAAIADINTLAGTQVNGRRILDGSANFGISGRSFSQIRRIDVLSFVGQTAPTSQQLSGEVLAAATQAALTYTGTSGNVGAGDTASFTLSGKRGTTTISTTAGEALTDVRDRINADSHKTGITASVAGDVLTFTSVDYGTAATLGVDVTSGTFAVSGGNGDGTDQGTDASVEINGRAAAVVDGNTVTYRDNQLTAKIEFAAGFTGTFDTVSISDDTALKFALSPQLTQITTLGISGVQAAQLGGLSGTLDQLASGGSLSGLATNVSQAIRVVDEAIGQLTQLQGSVDGFADSAVASSSALMSGFSDQLDQTLTDINGVNNDEEQLLLAKNQALATNALSALNVLQQQQNSIVDMIKTLAGLG